MKQVMIMYIAVAIVSFLGILAAPVHSEEIQIETSIKL